jgi:serine O-acetyltransferase
MKKNQEVRYGDWRVFAEVVASDLHRYFNGATPRLFLKALRREPGFRFTLLLRLCRFLREGGVLLLVFYPFAKFLFNRLSIRFLVMVDPFTEIGPGLYLGHPFMIVINSKAKIGANCSISHEVTLGRASRGTQEGYPTIGDGVYIGPGAKLVGNVTVGDGAAIGANAVVTKNVPSRGVAVGVPARVISYKGSEGYVTNLMPQRRGDFGMKENHFPSTTPSDPE